MRRLLAWFPVSILFAMSAAFGDIPDNVDYYLIWDGKPGAGAFDIPKNVYDYDPPRWEADLQTLFVDNQEIPNNIKHIWVEVEWISMLNLPSSPPDIQLGVAGDLTTFAPVPTSSGLGWTWHWTVDPQPPYEFIQFPDKGYWNLGQEIDETEPYYMGVDIVEVGTLCIPEPATLLLLALGCMGLVLRRKRGV